MKKLNFFSCSFILPLLILSFCSYSEGGAPSCNLDNNFPFNPEAAGVSILEESPIVGTMDVDNNSFGKDLNYFYFLNNFSLQKYESLNYTLLSESDLELVLANLGQSQALINPAIIHNKFAVYNEIILFMVVYNSITSKVVEYDTISGVARFVNSLSISSDMEIGYNPDRNILWINDPSLETYSEYYYNTTDFLYYLQFSESGIWTDLHYINNFGVWFRSFNRYTEASTNELVKYNDKNRTIEDYTIYCNYLEPISYHIVPDGNYLWAVINNNITKMEPLPGGPSAPTCNDSQTSLDFIQTIQTYAQNFGPLFLALGWFGFRRRKKE